MKILNKRYSALLIFIILQVSTSLFADSFYSANGLGLRHYFVSAQSVGMGSAGIGVLGELSINSINPAAQQINNMTTLSIDAFYERINSETNGNSVTTGTGYPSGFHFLIPVKKNINFLTVIRPLTTSQYSLSSSSQNEYVGFTRNVDGSGGLSSAGAGMQYTINKYLSVGTIVNFNFGSFSEKWKTVFDDDSYIEGTDELTSHLWGTSLDLGVFTRPLPKMGFGLVYSTKSLMHVKNSEKLGSSYEVTGVESDLVFPSSLGLGASWKFEKILLALDYYSCFWNNYKVNGIVQDDFNNYFRIGGGIEYLDSPDYLVKYTRRISLRAGAYYAQLPFKNLNGSKINEQFLTFGIALPFHNNFGRLDLSVEAGTRGKSSEIDFKDKVLRFSGSITGSELWFQRRQR